MSITKQEAIAYLDKMAEAKKVLIQPLDPDKTWYQNKVRPIYKEPKAFMEGIRELCEALNWPMIRKICEDHEVYKWEIYFYWKGVKFYDFEKEDDHGRPA